jgi:hypothetical protein
MRSIFIVGLVTILASVKAPAQNAEPGLITLACDGKWAQIGSGGDPLPVSNMGVVVNLPARSVAGFGEIVARIYRADDASILFRGDGIGSLGPKVSVAGSIDRVTGLADATIMTTLGSNSTTLTYDLLCKPARRLF